ncbi:protein of unknown function [Streptomyces sp. Ncost-T10-10d]|nr:DUF4158 domain-containing protein [Streptomyces sp. Ncost-T10-10d]SCF83312.1 protein of unknown function [Streptomyces sp. Ncost-T10-10d]
MAVEFLSDQQAAQYAAFSGAPSRAELERYFFLDDSDLEKVWAKQRAHNRLGFAVQLTSVRYLSRFMPDPRQVPAEVAEYPAEQLGIADPSCLKEYGERDPAGAASRGECDAALRRPAGVAAGRVLVDRRRPGVRLGHRGEARLKDLHVTIAALLVAHGAGAPSSGDLLRPLPGSSASATRTARGTGSAAWAWSSTRSYYSTLGTWTPR